MLILIRLKLRALNAKKLMLAYARLNNITLWPRSWFIHVVRNVRDLHGNMRRMFCNALSKFLVVQDESRWMGKCREVVQYTFPCTSSNGTAFVDMALGGARCTGTSPSRLLQFDSWSVCVLMTANKKRHYYSKIS